MVAVVTELLSAWRAAERVWESTPPTDPAYRSSAIAVVRAWLAYHEATDEAAADSFALVADDGQRYVAATEGVRAVLGYEPSELLGRQIEDIAAPDLVTATTEQWDAFVAAGRMDGSFRLRANDGTLVPVRFQARAHFPVAGFHLSRLSRDPTG